MGERFISRFRQKAKKNLTHYFWLIGKRAGIDWEWWVFNEEIGSVVDDIISAVKEELLHEIESTGGV